MDLSALSQALRSAVSLRDQVVVVRLDPTALDTPEHTEGAAQSLALLRALDLRVVVVIEVSGVKPGRRPAGPKQRPVEAAPSQLVGAISRHGQRSLTLLTAGVISVHKLMVAAPPPADAAGVQSWSASPTLVPMYIPVVDQALLIQLCSLRYIPILLLPVLDDAGEPIDISADEVSAAIGKFLEASLVVFMHGDKATGPAPDTGGRRAIVLSASAPDRLFAELLLGAATPAAAEAQPAAPGTRGKP